jgi:hypothetical protein
MQIIRNHIQDYRNPRQTPKGFCIKKQKGPLRDRYSHKIRKNHVPILFSRKVQIPSDSCIVLDIEEREGCGGSDKIC